jgi:hypothetical protein
VNAGFLYGCLMITGHVATASLVWLKRWSNIGVVCYGLTYLPWCVYTFR